MSKKRAKVGLGFDDKTLMQIPFRSDFVLKLMTHNYAYDIQCEGDRAWYAYRVFKFAKDKERILGEFQSYFKTLPENLYGGHKDHVFEVAVRLWKRGYLKRKDIFQVILHHQNLDGNNWVSLGALLKLGKKGIKLYVNEVGKSHAVDKYSDYYPCEEKNKRLLKLLKSNGIRQNDLSKDGAAFILDLKKWKRTKGIRKPRFSNFETYLTYILENRFRGRATKLFQSFSPEQVKELADRLKKETSADIQYGLMAPLAELDALEAPSLFLRLVDSKDRQVKCTAARILSKTKSGRIRKKALEMIRSSINLKCGVEMLSSNIEIGDDKLILSRLEALSSKHDLHDCGFGLLSATKVCDPRLLVDSLSYVYHHSRCSICRKRILMLLEACGGMSTRELSVAKYDASAEIRSYVKSKL